MLKRKEQLKIEDPEHLTIAQLKAELRLAKVSEHDISLCIERSQLNTLYRERLDLEFKACVVVQRHWRKVQDYRKARATQERMKREGLADEAANNMMTTASHEGKNDVFARLSNREVEFYREVFEKIDVDDSGQIDAGEVLRPLRSCCLE